MEGSKRGNINRGEQEGEHTWREARGINIHEGEQKRQHTWREARAINIDGRCTLREARELMYMEGSKRGNVHRGEQKG